MVDVRRIVIHVLTRKKKSNKGVRILLWTENDLMLFEGGRVRDNKEAPNPTHYCLQPVTVQIQFPPSAWR